MKGRPTKALKLWKDCFSSARAVMPVEKALERASQAVFDGLGIKVSVVEEGGFVFARATGPGGSVVEISHPGYRTSTVDVRITEQLLSSYKTKDLWR